MKNYEVVLDKPSTVKELESGMWYEREVPRLIDYTEAVICAFNEDCLKQKLEKLYPGVRVIRYKEI